MEKPLRRAPASAGRASTPTWSRARTARGCSWARSTPRWTFPADEPHADRCGTCTRCLSVCPTDAFPAPYRLDATRCISYLTIEHAGPIPHELRPLMGNRIYGCDDCLAVCPWNRFAHATPHPKLRAREDLTAPRLADACRAGRRRVPGDVRRLADQAHRPRPVRAQRADRDRQRRRPRAGAGCRTLAIGPRSGSRGSRRLGLRATTHSRAACVRTARARRALRHRDWKSRCRFVIPARPRPGRHHSPLARGGRRFEPVRLFSGVAQSAFIARGSLSLRGAERRSNLLP